MIIRPCSTCYLRKRCVRRAYIECEFTCHRDVALKSLTAVIKCDWFDRLYSPGARVSVLLHEYCHGDPQYNDYVHTEEGDFTGTIINLPDKKRNIAVWMDENDNVVRTTIKVPVSRLTFISEPPVRTCPVCGCPEGKKNHDGWACDECEKVTQ